MSNERMSDLADVSIGKAAALYDIAPSTLRWWESQRVVPKPSRVNGRRAYDEIELRRIGLAYLCCVTGGMTLEQAAVVTNGRRNEEWQRTVTGHARALEEKIEELQRARAYLMHLLECPDDDIVGECPWLDGELMSHTPRGRGPAESFVAAAHSIARPSRSAYRDETKVERDETGAPPSRCVVCASTFDQPVAGRRRRYCSRACQQRHYRENTPERSAQR